MSWDLDVNGTLLTLREDQIEFSPSRMAKESNANADGSPWVTGKMELGMIKATLDVTQYDEISEILNECDLEIVATQYGVCSESSLIVTGTQMALQGTLDFGKDRSSEVEFKGVVQVTS